jgi:hypothetical protein
MNSKMKRIGLRKAYYQNQFDVTKKNKERRAEQRKRKLERKNEKQKKKQKNML